MHDSGHKKHAVVGGYTKSASTLEAERRTSDRQMFTATAEVVEFVTGARFSTKTMDIGPGGCFMDTINPLPVGTRVHVRLTKCQKTFETGGSVVFSQNGMGMGIAFTNLDDAAREALQTWLSGLAHEREAAPLTADPSRSAEKKPAADQRSLTRLIRLMVTKGLLTEAEASSVLHEPVMQGVIVLGAKGRRLLPGASSQPCINFPDREKIAQYRTF
jgi:hypothetical protein